MFLNRSSESTVSVVMRRRDQEVTIDPTRLSALVEAITPELQTGRWAPQSFSILETRRHHEKVFLFCQLVYRDEEAHRRVKADLVVKCYGKKKGADSSCAALQYLTQAGFGANSQYRVPHLYGYLQEQGYLVQARTAGISWFEWLERAPARAARLASPAAEWLLLLQQIPIPAWVPSQRLSEAPYRCMVAPGALLQDLTEAFPIYTSRLKRIGEQLPAWRPQMQLSPGVLAHGDFHPKNILFAPSQTTVIDFDTFGVHEPAFDVGYCIGQLLSMAYMHCDTFAPGAAAASSFWRRYAREGLATWRRVSLATACTLIQILHYTLHASSGACARLLLPWLDLIEQYIVCDDPEILQRLSHPAREAPASA